MVNKTEFSCKAQEKAVILRDLVQMVGTCSVTGKEKELALLLAEKLKSTGLDRVETQEVEAGRLNVVASLKGAHPGPKILFTGHLDTVPAGGGW